MFLSLKSDFFCVCDYGSSVERGDIKQLSSTYRPFTGIINLLSTYRTNTLWQTQRTWLLKYHTQVAISVKSTHLLVPVQRICTRFDLCNLSTLIHPSVLFVLDQGPLINHSTYLNSNRSLLVIIFSFESVLRISAKNQC